MKKILITGAAGFIGFHLVKKMALEGSWDITGLDNINDYYDTELKYSRLKEIGFEKPRLLYNQVVKSSNAKNIEFIKLDIAEKNALHQLFDIKDYHYVVHLAAQAGVRHSLKNPGDYIHSNIVGFANILEECKDKNIKHLVYASSSSVYGMSKKMPLSVNDNVDYPVSLYAATKKSNELMAHAYSHLFSLPTTGLRFFTVYGPWGRPDMAYFKFVKSIMENTTLEVYNNGMMKRDFTFIDDIVNGIIKIIDSPPTKKSTGDMQSSSTNAPYKIYNMGNSKPVLLSEFIEILESELGKKSIKKYLPMQPGDVLNTESDSGDLFKDFGFIPKTDIREGLRKFVKWYIEWTNEKHN